jgi:uncharacterized protein YecT (DUF1311 family)
MLSKSRSLVAVAVAIALVSGIYFTNQASASQAGKEYQSADARLNQVYQTLISKINSPSQRRQLRTAQQAWIALRDGDGNFFGSYYVNSKGGLFYKTKLTKDRADYLQAIIDTPPTSNDSFGPEKYTD